MTHSKYSSLLILYFLLLVITGCKQNTKSLGKPNQIDSTLHIADKKINDTTNLVTPIENRILDTIFNLPEVKERAHYIEKETKGKRHLKVLIFQTPKENAENAYWVKAGEDNETTFVSHFNFFVFLDNLQIRFFDTAKDTLINLDTWRLNPANGK